MGTMVSSPAELFDNEWYIVRHSGETPEIALHSALYYLTRAKDGPHLVLAPEQLDALRQAAAQRYREIILRDLHHANAGTPIYRGVARSIVNYHRFCTFCRRQAVEGEAVRAAAGAALRVFLDREWAEVRAGRPTLINCGHAELALFAAELGLAADGPLAELAPFCPSGN
jgi:hypothetical protein